MKIKLHHITLLSSLVLFFNCSKDSSVEEEPIANKATASIAVTLTPANEPGVPGEFTVTLTNAVAEATILTLNFGGTATNGVDYETISATVTISPGTKSAKIPVNILDDSLVEDEETLEITLVSSSNGNVTIGTSNKATLIITETAENAFILRPEDTRSYMVNQNATDETVALFYNLKTLSQSKIIVGQQDSYDHFYKNIGGDTDIKKITGFDPGLNGLDFMFITDDKNDGTPNGQWYADQENSIKQDAKKAYDKGMVSIFSWHFREPYEGLHFYTEDMTNFQRQNAFKSILPGGENHEYYKRKLQKIAEVTKSLVGSDGKLIPIIFRPFHEFDGDWFWWGAAYCTPEQYKENWIFTVKYLRDDLGVTNMLFGFAPDASFTSESDYLSRYPGDDYVDVLGYDHYLNSGNIANWETNANNKLKIISKLAKERVKIASFTELGYSITPGQNSAPNALYTKTIYDAMTKNGVEIAFMMFWSNNETSYYTPPTGAPDAADFIQFTRKEDIVLQNKLPSMYTMPI